MDEPKRNRVWELLGAGHDCPAIPRSLGMSVDTVRAIEAKAGGNPSSAPAAFKTGAVV